MSVDDILRRVPPQSPESEQSVLGAILIVGNGDDVVADQAAIFGEIAPIVSAEDFYRENHREIYRAMVDLSLRKLPVDAVTLTHLQRSRAMLEAAGGPAYIAELAAAVPTAANVAYYARIVREKSVLRSLASTATGVASGAYDSPREVREYLAAAETKIAAVARLSLGEEEGGLKDAMQELIIGIEGGHLAGVPSGFAELDRYLTAGGFSRPSLNIIAAATSVGKTAISLNIAVRGELPGGTLILSTEMNRDELLRRLIADLEGIDWAWIARRRPPMPTDDETKRIARAMERLLSMKIDVRYRRRLTPADVLREGQLAMARFDGKLDLIVCDYLQLMNPDQPEKRRDLEIGAITWELKILAGELNTAIVLLSQLNREGAKTDSGEPELWHLRESGAIEQDADCVVFLWEDRIQDKSNRFDPIKVNWKIAKQRNGVKPHFEPLLFEQEFARFRANKISLVPDETE